MTVVEGNSLDPDSLAAVRNFLADEPEMILLDSSHEYVVTVQELELWYPALQAGGLFLLHDVSLFATDFDVTKEGAVRRAFDEWRRKNPQAEAICLNGESRTMDLPRPLYKDACGLGLIHKPGLPAPTHYAAGACVALRIRSKRRRNR